MLLSLENTHFNSTSHDLTTISGRLNALWDFVGYAPLHKNRTTEIQRSLGLKPTSAKNYVLYNYLPARKTLETIVEDALSRLPNGQQFKEGAVIAWLEHGEESGCPCPFIDNKSTRTRHISMIVTGSIAYRANQLGISLTDIPPAQLMEIAGKVADKVDVNERLDDFDQLKKSDIAIIDGLLWAAIGS